MGSLDAEAGLKIVFYLAHQDLLATVRNQGIVPG
jgi:hypothetical protein